MMQGGTREDEAAGGALILSEALIASNRKRQKTKVRGKLKAAGKRTEAARTTLMPTLHELYAKMMQTSGFPSRVGSHGPRGESPSPKLTVSSHGACAFPSRGLPRLA